MIFGRFGSFAGGIDLPDDKRRTLALPIAPMPSTPSRLLVPLAPSGAPAEPIVEIGRHVSFAQHIAQPRQPRSQNIYSPLAGRVAGFTTARTADRDDYATTPAIELVDCSPPGGIKPLAPVYDFRNAESSELRDRIAEGGLSTCRRRPQPLGWWVQRARDNHCHTLIANAMEHQPYVTSDHRLLCEYGTEVVRGLAILARAIEVDTILLAVDGRRTDDYRELVGPARLFGVDLIALGHKYPTGSDAVLAKVLTKREVPLGGTVMDLGVAMIDPAACFAAYRWVVCESPPLGRVVTLSGEHAEQPGNFWVPYGTPCEHLVGSLEGTHIHGGPMTGLRLRSNVVVGPTTDAVLSLAAPAPLPPSPCIRCGWCTDHCPARLNVSALNDHFEMGDVDTAWRSGTLSCVHCGICTYVCPARLPLAQRVQELKRSIYVMRRAEATTEHARKARNAGDDKESS
ncbi:MAG: RnfABCDGE type electron transport complex subunit C [Planctomycetota bacterium]